MLCAAQDAKRAGGCVGQPFDDAPKGKDLVGVQRVVRSVVDVHRREVADAQVPFNVALCAQWGGRKSFAKGGSAPAAGLAQPQPQQVRAPRAPCATRDVGVRLGCLATHWCAPAHCQRWSHPAARRASRRWLPRKAR